MRRLSTFILASMLVLPVPSALAQDPPSTMDQALALFSNQDWAGAARAYQAITEAEPDNATAWFGLGRSYFNGRQVDRALEAYAKALDLGFEPARTMIHLARCHATIGEDAEALTWIEKAAATGASIYKALESTPEFHRLHNDPTFRELVERGRPCNTPAHHLLDFWVSSWRVVVGEEQRQVGKNSIQKILNGCAIIENWTDVTGSEGKSLFYLDEVERIWKQVWITDSGGLKEKHLIGVLDNGAVRFQGELRTPEGGLVLDRTTLIPVAENQVRQVIEQSVDGGETWQVAFDALYLP